MIYHNYIFRRTIVSFLGIASILIVLVWFSRAVPFVRYVTENGIELSQFFYIFLLILPWLLVFIIPISLFISVVLTLRHFIDSNEITILKNFGLTKIAICKPIILLSLIVSILCFLVSFYLMPYANKQLRLSRINIADNYVNLSFNPQTFETLKELTIYARDRDKDNILSGILLHDKRSKEYSITITAKSGKIVAENNAVLLQMNNGTVQKLDYKNKKSEILNFDDYVFNLSEQKHDDEKMRWKAKERYLHELFRPEGDLEEGELKKYNSEIHQRFTYPLLSFVFSLIACALILRGQFNRNGNLRNILLTILVTVTFLILVILSYNLIESKPSLTPLLYLNFILFTGLGLSFLSDRKHSINTKNLSKLNK